MFVLICGGLNKFFRYYNAMHVYIHITVEKTFWSFFKQKAYEIFRFSLAI